MVCSMQLGCFIGGICQPPLESAGSGSPRNLLVFCKLIAVCLQINQQRTLCCQLQDHVNGQAIGLKHVKSFLPAQGRFLNLLCGEFCLFDVVFLSPSLVAVRPAQEIVLVLAIHKRNKLFSCNGSLCFEHLGDLFQSFFQGLFKPFFFAPDYCSYVLFILQKIGVALLVSFCDSTNQTRKTSSRCT